MLFAFAVLALLFLGQIKTQSSPSQLIGIVTFLILGSFILGGSSIKKYSGRISVLILIFLISAYATQTTFPKDKSKNISLDEPVGCTSDEQDFLKTFYLMEKGGGFYGSFSNALVNCGGFAKAPNDSTGWRLPTIFYLWKLTVQNGAQIRTIFLILSSAALLCAYLITKKLTDDKIALLSPYLIIPYFLEAGAWHSFLFPEWWGLFAFIFALAALFYDKRNLSLLLLITSVLTRETYLIPALVLVIVDFAYHRKVYYPVLFLATVASFWILHNVNISNAVGRATFFPQSRIHPFDKNALMSSLAFSTKAYQFVSLRIATLLLVISSAGLLKFFLQRGKTGKFAVFGAASFLALAFLAPFIVTRATYNGVYQYADYWGIAFVPLAIIFAPAILASKSKQS